MSDLGDIQFSTHYDLQTGAITGFTIDHADPRILIADELLRLMIIEDPSWPHTEIELAPYEPGQQDPLIGAVVRLHGINRTVVYRITEAADFHCHIAEWPD